MPPILLGVFASILVGLSDTFGRMSARRADSVSHVSMQMAIGVVVSVPLIVVVSSDFIGRDVGAGTASGVLVAVGLAIVYKAMAESSAAVAAPSAAIVAALVPLIWDLVGGTRLSTLEAVGCVVAVISLGFTTFNPDLGDKVVRGLVMAVVGGICFGLSIALAGDTSEDSGAWPALMQRAGGFVAMVALARARSVPAWLPEGVRRYGVLGGIAGALGMACWIIGAQQGDLGTVSVVGATYPAVVALLSTFDGDDVRWWQALGIAGAITGSILIAAG